jgi:plastocyanin
MFRPSRRAALAFACALATVALVLSPALPVAASNGATTWHVQAGNLDDLTFTSVAQDMTAFYNARTFVHPGDDVVFTPVDGHTVTFNPILVPGVPTFAYADPNFPAGPTGSTLMFANRSGGALLNSGAIATPGFGPPGTPSSFTLHIGADAAGVGNGDDEAGTTYRFFCMFHRAMTGFITVLPRASRLPFTELQNQARAQRAMQADLARGSRALREAGSDIEDGRVAAGLGVASVQGAGADLILRFAPATITVNVGQSVTWTNRDLNEVHTVTFGVEKPGPPGAPPGFLPYGGNVINSATDQVNSGFLISQELIDYINGSSLFPPGFVITRQVTYTFTKPGTYHYFCALHDFLGMTGTVIVTNADDQTSG